MYSQKNLTPIASWNVLNDDAKFESKYKLKSEWNIYTLTENHYPYWMDTPWLHLTVNFNKVYRYKQTDFSLAQFPAFCTTQKKRTLYCVLPGIETACYYTAKFRRGNGLEIRWNQIWWHGKRFPIYLIYLFVYTN